jgi:hypothetical protein
VDLLHDIRRSGSAARYTEERRRVRDVYEDVKTKTSRPGVRSLEGDKEGALRETKKEP